MPRRQPPTLGEIIRQERELLDLSMRQFADRAGISNPYLSQIERGLRAPSEQVLNAIARTLRMSADALYERAGIHPQADEHADTAVLDAIAADKRLSARQRSALKEVYQAFVAARPAPTSRARAR
jgi:transcriptional regulator with XRE-family HTH domain